MCEICSKFTINTRERRQRSSTVFIVKFEHISHIFQVTLNRYMFAGYHHPSGQILVQNQKATLVPALLTLSRYFLSFNYLLTASFMSIIIPNKV